MKTNFVFYFSSSLLSTLSYLTNSYINIIHSFLLFLGFLNRVIPATFRVIMANLTASGFLSCGVFWVDRSACGMPICTAVFGDIPAGLDRQPHYHHNYLGPLPPFPHVLLLEAPSSGPVFHLCHSPPVYRKFTYEQWLHFPWSVHSSSFLFIALALSEVAILTVMSYDRVCSHLSTTAI